MSACERVWIGLGGNLGDVAATLAAARAALRALSAAEPVFSPIYESEPWGAPDQPPFLNQVAGVVPTLGPAALLAALQAIEARHGRVRRERWGPRSLDLDLLSWPGVESNDPALTLPHPRLTERRFVLAPWADVAPDLVVRGRRVAEWLRDCSDPCWVRRLP